jgi:hypothetical protein
VIVVGLFGNPGGRPQLALRVPNVHCTNATTCDSGATPKITATTEKQRQPHADYRGTTQPLLLSPGRTMFSLFPAMSLVVLSFETCLSPLSGSGAPVDDIVIGPKRP